MLLFLILITSLLHVQAQILDCVTDVTYTTVETKVLYLPQNVSFDDIAPYDISGLNFKQKTKTHHEWVDDTGKINHEIILKDAVNCHEDWENLSNKWVFNEKGMTSYTSGPKGGEKLNNQITYTSTTIQMYNLHKQDVLLKGILVNKVFPPNVKTELTNSNIPFIVVDPGIIMIGDSIHLTIYNENPPKTITTVTFKTGGTMPSSPPTPDDPNIKETEVDVFYINKCGEDLLSTVVTMVNDTLSNGLCSKRVKTIYYDDYQFTCCGLQPQVNANENQFVGDIYMKIFPNPLSSGTLSIEFPDSFSDEEVVISINTIDGKLIHQFTPMIGKKKLALNVNSFLDKQGIYLLKAVSKDRVITKKFFFVK